MRKTYEVWVPGFREFDPVIHPATTDPMTVIAQLRQHEHRVRYVAVDVDGRRVGHLSFHAGRIATLADL